MDGFEFIARIRASSDADIRDIPAAALTAFARSEDRTKAGSSVVSKCISRNPWTPANWLPRLRPSSVVD
jgi:CheY-like chemotaxis protein